MAVVTFVNRPMQGDVMVSFQTEQLSVDDGIKTCIVVKKPNDDTWSIVKFIEELNPTNGKYKSPVYITGLAANTTYQIKIVKQISTGDFVDISDFDAQTITVKFRGLCIYDKNATYRAIGDFGVSQFTRNIQTSVVPVLNQKYPYVIQNGESNYDSGDCSGMFTRVSDCKPIIEDSFNYHKNLVNFLTDGNAKILKNEDGKIWLVAISGSPTVSNSEHPDKWITQFQWTEIGDVYDTNDLKNANLL